MASKGGRSNNISLQANFEKGNLFVKTYMMSQTVSLKGTRQNTKSTNKKKQAFKTQSTSPSDSLATAFKGL